MEMEISGEVTYALVVTFITFITQGVKEWRGWEGNKVKGFSLVLSYGIGGTWAMLTLMTLNPEPTWLDLAWMFLKTLIFPGFIWLTVTGAYHALLKPSMEKYHEMRGVG